MENLYESFNRSEIKQGGFLDFSKAFDSIDHNILLQKLPHYHFTSSAIKLVSSYLTDRSQYRDQSWDRYCFWFLLMT